MAAHSEPRHTWDSAASRPGFGARSIATLVGLLAGLVVVPAALWAWRHNPLPTQLEPARWVRLAFDGYIHPDVVPDLLAVAGWLVWAQFVVALGREMAARVRRGAAASRSMLVLPPIQRLACHLVAAISVLVAVGVRPESVQPLATLGHASLAAAAAPVPGQAANVAGRMSQDPECVTFADADPGDPVLAGRLHVCGPYDTLRSLAAREYGDPARWTFIRDASVGLRQTDGTRLQPGFVAVAEGTRLHIPRSSSRAESHPLAPRDGVFVPSAGEYTVRRGDCLWEIAETHYPQAEPSDIPDIIRAIFSANRGVSDGQGHQLRDPDLINPGMVLHLPTVTSGKASSRPRVDTAPNQFPPASPPGSPAVSPKASPAPAPSASVPANRPAAAAPTSPATREPAWDTVGEPPVDEPTVPAALPLWVAGASLLASGFAAVWAYRRRRRDGKVRPGQAVPPPDPSLVPLHTAIRVAADSDGPTRLDAALRSLAAPHARAGKGVAPVVQVLLRQPEGDLEVFLREALATLPASWQPTSDPRIWRLPETADLVLDAPARAMPNPNPAIVQLGTTRDGAEFYIDLEAVGVLAIGADDDTHPDAATAHAGTAPLDDVPVSLRGIARAVTATLATSPLADIPRIRTIGFDPFGLADEERIHAESSADELVDHVTADVEVIRRQMNDRNLDSTLRLRVCRPEEAWDPTIAVVGDRHLAPEHAERLMTMAGNGSQGLAVILPAEAAPSATWRLVLHQHVPAVPSSRRARWRLDPLGVVLAPISLAADELEDLAALLNEADIPALTLGPDEAGRPPDVSDRTADLPDGPTTGPARKNGQAAGGADAGSSARPRFAEPDWQVMVRLLGPVDVIGRDGATPTGVRDRTLETLAWLVLHRRNVTRTDLEAALWPTGARTSTVSNTLSRARAALEEIAGPEAHAWIPGHQAGLGIDRAVTSDLEQLQARLAYATRHRNNPQIAMPVLRDGLALVRGVPAGYPWLDAELGSTLTITPTTAAILLAELYLEQGDFDGVLEATETGLAVLPAHPELFALRMKARAATGDRRAVRAEYEAYLRAESADPMADGETDRDLERLYLELMHTSAR